MFHFLQFCAQTETTERNNNNKRNIKKIFRKHLQKITIGEQSLTSLMLLQFYLFSVALSTLLRVYRTYNISRLLIDEIIFKRLPHNPHTYTCAAQVDSARKYALKRSNNNNFSFNSLASVCVRRASLLRLHL